MSSRALLLLTLLALGWILRPSLARADTVDDLLGSLEDSSDKVRVASAQALGKLGPAAKYTLTLTELADSSRGATPDLVKLVRDGLSRALAKKSQVALAGADRRLSPLVNHLKTDSSSLVREVCAQALGKIQDPSAVPALQAAQTDGDDGVRKQATAALAMFARAFLVDGSITVLKVSDGSELDCEVKVLIATVPGKSIKSWVTEDATIPDITASSPTDVAGAKHDCLDSLGDPLADDIMKYVATQ